MAHLNAPRFPDEVAVGYEFGPEYSVEVVRLGARDERRNALSLRGMCKGQCAHPVLEPEGFRALLAFFRAVGKGRLNTFRFKDWSDYEVGPDQGVLAQSTLADAVPGRTLQLQRLYHVAVGFAELRDVQAPIGATVTLLDASADPPVALVPGSDYTLDDTLGIVTMAADTDPATLAWVGEFDCVCRFDTDHMPASMQAFALHGWDAIPVQEVYLYPEDIA